MRLANNCITRSSKVFDLSTSPLVLPPFFLLSFLFQSLDPWMCSAFLLPKLFVCPVLCFPICFWACLCLSPCLLLSAEPLCLSRWAAPGVVKLFELSTWEFLFRLTFRKLLFGYCCFFCYPFTRLPTIFSRHVRKLSCTIRQKTGRSSGLKTPDMGLSQFDVNVLRFDKFLNRRAHHSIVRSSCGACRQVSVRGLLCLSFNLLLESRERVVHLRHHFTFCRTSHESDMPRAVSFTCVWPGFVKLRPRNAARKRSAARWVT